MDTTFPGGGHWASVLSGIADESTEDGNENE